MSGSPRQRKAPYPPDFDKAVKPPEVTTFGCNHEVGKCTCVHDWRIEWRNMPRENGPKTAVI